MSQSAMIDLDHSGPVAPERPPLRRLTWARLGPTARRRLGTRLGMVGSLLLALSSGASAPHPRTFEIEFVQPVAPNSVELVGGGTLFVSSLRSGRAELAAYSGGRQRWHIRSAATGQKFVGLQYGAGVVTMTVSPDLVSAAQTTAYDAMTGRRRWTFPAFAAQSISDELILTRQPLPDRSAADGSRPPFELAARRFTTGEPVWATEIDESAGDRWGLDGDGGPGDRHWLATITATGRLTLRDLRTGRIAARRTGIPVEAVGLVHVANGLVVVRRYESVLTAYDLTTLEYRWTQANVPLEQGANGCGRYLCLKAAGQLTALRPDTGTPAWRVTGAEWVTDAGNGYLVAWSDHLFQILSTATGRTAIDLHGWEPAKLTRHDPRGGPPVLLAIPGGQDRPGRTPLALIHPDTGTIEAVGQLDGDWDSCQLIELTATRGRLYCSNTPGTAQRVLAEWRFRT